MNDKLPDSTIEKEFLNFVQKLRTRHPSHGVSYQLNNYPEGIECTFRIARVAGQNETSNSFSSKIAFEANGGSTNVGTASTMTTLAPSKSDLDESLTEEEKARIEAKRAKKAAKLKLKRLQFKEKQRLKKMQALAGENGDQTKNEIQSEANDQPSDGGMDYGIHFSA